MMIRAHDDQVVGAVHHREREEAPGARGERTDEVHRATADTVRQPAHQGNRDEVHGMRGEQPPQDVAGVSMDLHLEVGDREGDDQVVHDVLGEAQPHRGENATRVTLQHFDDAVRGGLDPLDLLLCRDEDRRIGDLGADVVADQHDHRGQPECDPPTPRQERVIGQRPCQHQQHNSGQHVADGHGGLRPAGPERATLVRAVLGDQQDGATPFAADGEALDEPQHNQHGRRPISDLPERRQAAHQERRDTDQQQAELE